MDDFKRVHAIFDEILAAPAELRADLVETLCEDNRPLAKDVRLLLGAHEAEERTAASNRDEARTLPYDRLEHERVGPYEIDRVLGCGGMGVVYLAHRADGQFEQKVAIKLVHVLFASDEFCERFRQERQILAGLQHPYIARLLDGGVSSEGKLYLVMEYVNGLPIHRFCQERQLSQTRRIGLFLRVCEAVQFAHQNFVVHRDLKPDNILVAEDGAPRLLDFGTAKLLSPAPGRQDSQLTRDGYLSFTPQYASPEQVQGNPITTASDTYSLGVLLYLLLTGMPPYELKDMTMGQMLKTICEEAPRRPSAAGRDKRLEADLEAILLKALRKDPQERYLTAERLADDLRAYLQGLPVAARRDNFRYRASKFIRRHRWGLAAAAVLVVTLLAGVAGVAWQARVANEERRKADARSTDLRELSNSLLTELDEAIKQIPGSTGAQKLLVTSVLKHLDRMARDAHGDRQTQLDLADAYTRLGNLQGNAYVQNLGDPAGALNSISKAIALTMPFAAGDSTDREALHALASAQLARSRILFGTAPIQQAIDSTQAAIASYERLIALPGATPDDISNTATAYTTLGDELGFVITQSLNDLAGADSAYRRSLELYNRALSIDPNLIGARRNLAAILLNIIPSEKESDPVQTLTDIHVSLQRIAALPVTEQQSLRTIVNREHLLVDEAIALVQLGEYSEANTIAAGPVQSSMRRAAVDPKDLRALNDVLFSLDRQAEDFEEEADPALGASIDDRRRNLAAAEKPLIEERAGLERMLRLDPSQTEWRPVLADVQVRLGSIQFILHHGQNPAELVRKGLATLRGLIEKEQSSPGTLDTAARNLLIAQPATLRDPHLAVSCAERVVILTHRRIPARLSLLAQAYRAAGQIEKSRAAAKEGLALLPTSQPGSVKPRIRKLLEIQEQSGF
jgi:serine/threonine protein kinase